MPEGDTIFRTARTLHKALAGHRATHFDTAYAHLARVDDDRPDCRAADRAVRSRRQARADRVRGRPDPADAHAHERLVASLSPRRALVARAAGHARAPRHRATGWRSRSTCRWRSSSPPSSWRRPIRWRRLGPDLLKPDFDRDEAIRRVRAAGALPIAQALLDQRLVAGIGNVYKSEVLFLAGVHPDTPPSAVPQDAIERIMDIGPRAAGRQRGRRDTGRDPDLSIAAGAPTADRIRQTACGSTAAPASRAANAARRSSRRRWASTRARPTGVHGVRHRMKSATR